MYPDVIPNLKRWRYVMSKPREGLEPEETKENALKLLRLFLRLSGRDGSISRLKDR